MFTPVERSRAFERVVEQIEAAIYAGELSAGDHLPSERALVEEFRVGRSTVREALRILESMGLIRTLPGSQLGAQVSPFNTAGLQRSLNGLARVKGVRLVDLVQYRMINGSAANYLAARLRSSRTLAKMAQASALMARPGISAEEFARADVEFHQAIAEASDNALLTMVNDVVHDMIIELVAGAISSSPDGAKTRREFLELHAQLQDAITAGDAERASDLARRSLYEAYGPMLAEEERAEIAVLLPPPEGSPSD